MSIKTLFITTAVFFYSLLSSNTFAADWAMFLGNAAHNAATNNAVDADDHALSIHNLKLAWQYDFHTQVNASPIVVGHQLFVGGENGNLYALDIKTRKPLWIFHAQGAISSTPAVAGNHIYFLSRDGYCYAVNIQDGSLLWKFATLGEHYFSAHGMYGLPLTSTPIVDPWDFYLSSPIVHNGKVYVGSSDEHLYALDAKTGALHWRFKTGGVVHSSPAFADDKIIVGSWDSAVYAVDATNGKEVWRYQGEGEHTHSIMLGVQASPVIDADNVYIGSRDGHVYALKLQDGALRWRYDAQGSWVLSSAAVDENAVYVGTSDTGLLVALDKKTGEERFRFTTQNWTYASPVLLADHYLAVGTMTGELFIVDKRSAERHWFYQTEERKLDLHSILNAKGTLDTEKLFGKPEYIHAALEKVKHLGAFIASPIWVNEHLFTVDANGRLRVFH